MLWVTFNEPTLDGINELRYGGLSATDVPVMQDRIVQAHNAIYDHIHQMQPGAMVTSNVAYLPGVDDVLNKPFIDKIAARPPAGPAVGLVVDLVPRFKDLL
jgi:beta-glucosidase